MKIWKTFLLVIYTAIAKAEDITLKVRVAEFKDADKSDAVTPLTADWGFNVDIKFLSAGNIEMT